MCVHDIKLMHLCSAAGQWNSPLCKMSPSKPPLDWRVADKRERREDQEACKRLVDEDVGETYMAEIHRHHPTQVEAEERVYVEYAA